MDINSGALALQELSKRLQAGTISAQQAAQAFTPVSANEATPTVEYKSPTNVNLNTSMSGATTAMGLIDNQISNLESEKKAADDFLTSQGATGNSFYEKLMSMLGNKPKVDTQGVLADQQAKYGIDDQLNTLKGQNLKIAGLQGDIQKLETEEMTAIDRAEGRVASRGAIEGEKETITRDYNIKKAYKYAELYAEAAVATAMSGNLNESRNLVKDAVDAYTYDIEQKISQFDEMFSVASSWVSALDTKEQNLLQTKRAELQAEADQLKQDKTAIGNLMIEYNQYGAGIKLTDTLEEAQAKAGSVAGAANTQIIGSAETGYQLINAVTGEVIKTISSGTSSGTLTTADNFTDFMTNAINSGATAEQAAHSAVAYAESLGIQMSAKDLTNLVAKAKALQKTKEEKENFNPAIGFGDGTPKPSDTGAYNAGKAVKGAFGAAGNFFTEPYTRTVKPAVTSFFGGLFGK